MCSKIIRNLIVCLNLILHAEENDPLILLEEKHTETPTQTNHQESKQEIFKQITPEEIHKKKRQLYMLKGELYEQEKILLTHKVAQEKSGFFMGVLLGEVGIKAYFHRSNQLGSIQNYPLVYGIRGGYQKYFVDGFSGMRFYGEYFGGAMQGFKNNSLASYQIASLNLDLIMDKPIDKEKRFALGVFGGLGVGWNGMFEKLRDIKGYSQPNGFNLVLNLGVSMTLNLKHRFELALKMPPLKEASQRFLYYFKSTNVYYISYNYLL
ncbi:outer membrane beta-barrel protein [Helicobacter cetorum]|uniref:Outer membrane protein n=1 Tax=Helicobacter cetorum (strain ATCC BAA-540 / CCUG 52418 / MIT 99-5656) TaxID=1163745 RepID=I0EUJ1_HELCM|nr:outer membrane beta-barrel protein [Helicobacter cetorum]AFI06610.1 hypothetical protein HCD_08130 [Helicobacter cetorum MIT 99-5656]